MITIYAVRSYHHDETYTFACFANEEAAKILCTVLTDSGEKNIHCETISVYIHYEEYVKEKNGR